MPDLSQSDPDLIAKALQRYPQLAPPLPPPAAAQPAAPTPMPGASAAPQGLGPPPNAPRSAPPTLASHIGDIVQGIEHHLGNNHPTISPADIGTGMKQPAQPMPPALGRPLPPPLSQGGATPAQAELGRLTAQPRPEITDPGTGLVLPGTDVHSPENTGAPGFQQIHNPWLRGLATVGNAIGGAVVPRIMQGIPGTELHHQQLVGQAAKSVGEEAGLENEAQKRQLEEAQTENQLSEVGTHGKTAKDAKIPTNETELWIQQHPDGTAEELKDFLKKTVADKPITNATELWLKEHPDGTAQELQQFLLAGKPEKEGNDFEQFYKQYLNDNGLTDTSKNRLAAEAKFAAAKQPPQRAPIIDVFVPNQEGGYTVTPARAGTNVPEGFMTGTQAGSMSTPTQTMKNAASQAKIVHQEMPRVVAEIDAMGPRLGPLAGRWNEFMQGKVGMDDPDFAGLRADLLMMSSAVALAHARGRLPENLREEFDHAINAPKQTPANLKAILQKVDTWMVDNQDIMMHPGSKAGGSTGGAASKPEQGGYKIGTKYGGMTYQGGDPNDAASWKK